MTRIKFFIFLALTCFIGQYLTRIQGPTMLYWAVTLPGTFFHEAAHWLAAFFLQGNPETFSIFPTFNSAGQMETMGHITSYDNWYNAATVGMAPFMLMPFTALCIVRAATTKNWVSPIMWCYFAACSWTSFIPSEQDFSVSMVPSSWPLAALIIGSFFYMTYRIVKRAALW
jgi:hypothetical protein